MLLPFEFSHDKVSFHKLRLVLWDIHFAAICASFLFEFEDFFAETEEEVVSSSGVFLDFDVYLLYLSCLLVMLINMLCSRVF